MPSPFLSERVVIVTPAVEASPYGGTRVDWDSATRATAVGFIAQRVVSEDAPENARTDDGAKWSLVLNGDPAVTQQSRIEYGGEVFRIVARPKRVGVRGQIRHVELVLMPVGE